MSKYRVWIDRAEVSDSVAGVSIAQGDRVTFVGECGTANSTSVSGRYEFKVRTGEPNANGDLYASAVMASALARGGTVVRDQKDPNVLLCTIPASSLKTGDRVAPHTDVIQIAAGNERQCGYVLDRRGHVPRIAARGYSAARGRTILQHVADDTEKLAIEREFYTAVKDQYGVDLCHLTAKRVRGFFDLPHHVRSLFLITASALRYVAEETNRKLTTHDLATIANYAWCELGITHKCWQAGSSLVVWVESLTSIEHVISASSLDTAQLRDAIIDLANDVESLAPVPPAPVEPIVTVLSRSGGCTWVLDQHDGVADIYGSPLNSTLPVTSADMDLVNAALKRSMGASFRGDLADLKNDTRHLILSILRTQSWYSDVSVAARVSACAGATDFYADGAKVGAWLAVDDILVCDLRRLSGLAVKSTPDWHALKTFIETAIQNYKPREERTTSVTWPKFSEEYSLVTVPADIDSIKRRTAPAPTVAITPSHWKISDEFKFLTEYKFAAMGLSEEMLNDTRSCVCSCGGTVMHSGVMQLYVCTNPRCGAIVGPELP